MTTWALVTKMDGAVRKILRGALTKVHQKTIENKIITGRKMLSILLK